jgi:tetraacyldisaccharide 4'-kinase
MTLAPNIMLAPLGALYGASMRARLALYRRGAFRIQRLDAPVISVGNITTGGTGKTPLVAWLAQMLAQQGQRPCILTRGYGRASQQERVVVSDGERLLADAHIGGDEPRLLAEMLQGIAAVISDADRAAAGRWALKNLGSTVFILDDGFQHLRVARDLDLVTIDATNPWGGGPQQRGSLLPRGRLREPLDGLARADCLIITRTEQVSDVETLRTQAQRLSNGRPVILSHTHTRRIRPLQTTDAKADNKTSFQTQPSTTQPIFAFCALGNSQSFFTHLRNAGYVLADTQAFPDHHIYTQRDIDALTQRAHAHGAQALLTTAKDAVKLRALDWTLPCFVVEIEIVFDNEPKLLRMIEEVL